MGVEKILSNNRSVTIRLEKFLKGYISNESGPESLAEVMSDLDSESQVKKDFMSSIFVILKEHSYKILVKVTSEDLDIPRTYLPGEYIESSHNEIFKFLLKNITNFIQESYIGPEKRIEGNRKHPIDIEKFINNIVIGADVILDKAVSDFSRDMLIEYTVKGVLDDMVMHVDDFVSRKMLKSDGISDVADLDDLSDEEKGVATVFRNRVHPSASENDSKNGCLSSMGSLFKR